jgi:hypothetical protein
MKPRLIVALLLSIASICTASMLFLDSPPQASRVRSSPSTSIDIKWGEGSEAGTPDTALHK